MLIFLTLWFVTFDPCLCRLASSAAVFKNLPISFFPKGRLHVPHLRISSAVAVSYSKEEWSVWLVHFFRLVATERLVKLDRTPLCVGGVCFWRGRTPVAIFFTFTGLGAPLIQPNKHFATIVNWIRLQGNVSPEQFTALVAGSKPEMQGENQPHGSLKGYGIFCTECATLKKLVFFFFSQRASRVGTVAFALHNKVSTLGFQHFS